MALRSVAPAPVSGAALRRQLARGRRARALAVGLESVIEAGLHWVSDLQPGIRRRRAGKGFSYVGPDGTPVRATETVRRVRALAIPPAWTDVWICADPHGHIQATGRDARGRKQYRYHQRWRAVRDEAKFGRLLAFGMSLPAIREQCRRDIGRAALDRDRVAATVVALLDRTYLRVGSEEYARQNDSFGATTLRNRHASVRGATVRFQFRGKAGKDFRVELTDARLARVIRRCQELPGQELFQYLDEAGMPRSVGSADVNEYLRTVSGQDFTAKDFRTWAGTLEVVRSLSAQESPETEAAARRNVNRAIEAAAAALNNTPAICRRCYVHPVVVAAYLDHGWRGDSPTPTADSPEGVEAALLELLRGATADAAGSPI